MMIEIILKSFLLIFLSEMGDKTQLLTLILVAQFKRPWAILHAIFWATLANHYLAAISGVQIVEYLPKAYFDLIIGFCYLGFGVWILIPDKDPQNVKFINTKYFFLTIFIVFFLMEIGDKTQIATMTLAAQYNEAISVTIGSTLGLFLSSLLVVLLGDQISKKINFKTIRYVTSVLFLLFAGFSFYQFLTSI